MTTTTDYLIKGCGLMGLGFADKLARETDAHITLVDERAAPGGHWNDSYSFVTLHQPAPLYGVASSPLGDEVIDPQGCNAGLMRLPSGGEVAVHFRRVLQERLWKAALRACRLRLCPTKRQAFGTS
jgi:glycine/D-amino acid oxidase-like deaminating enzyme